MEFLLNKLTVLNKLILKKKKIVDSRILKWNDRALAIHRF